MVYNSTLHRSIALLALLIQLGRAVPASTPEQALDLLQRRQSSCPSTAPVSCRAVDPKLPSNFCCQAGTTCYSLDSSTTALCCPSGSNCDGIQPINCDVSLEDPKASANQNGSIFTTRLNDKLAACGTDNKCCPFGYICNKRNDGSSMCQIVVAKAITQPPSSSTSSGSSSTSGTISATSSTSSATSTPSTVSPASATSIDSTKPNSQQSANPFPAPVFLAGFFPGILVGALGVLAWVILTGRHRKPNDNASITSSVYKKKLHISGPIAVKPSSAQSGFFRKSTVAAKGLFSKRRTGEGTPGLPMDDWKMPTPPEPNNIPDRPVGQQIQAGPGARAPAPPALPDSSQPTRPLYPVTPERQIYRQYADTRTETIHVYSPEMEVPSAAVPPLRGMHSRGRSSSPSFGGDFMTPDRPMVARTNGPSGHTPAYSYDTTPYQTLTPTRYEGNTPVRRLRPEDAVQQGRPETTFTTVLEAAGFPDPLNPQNRPMPPVPQQYRRR